MSFLKSPASCGKKILKLFLLRCISICMSLKSVPQIFKTLLQAGDVNIFVLLGVLFGRYVQLKSFSDEENISGEI